MKFRENAKKIPAFSAEKKNSLKIGLRHILGIVILHLYAKQQKLMSRSWEKLATDERTNELMDEGTKINL